MYRMTDFFLFKKIVWVGVLTMLIICWKPLLSSKADGVESRERITLELMDFVGSFPEEVTDMILSLLSANDLENCSSVSQLWSSTIKRFQQGQTSRLKYNWENGKFSVHCFPISEEFYYSFLSGVEELASNYSYDQFLHYPAFMFKKGSLDSFYFSVVRIDAELMKTINLFQYSGFSGCIKKVWVMGDSVIWLSIHNLVKSLHYINASLALNTEIKTIDEWNVFNRNCIFLKMDRNYIAVSNKKLYVKAWCKHSLELKLEQKCRDDALQHISLFDGCLVISNTFKAEPTSVIEIHNLKSDSNNGSTLKHTFTVDGQVQDLHSNKHYIVLNTSFGIQVFSKQSYSIIYSYNYGSHSSCRIEIAHDNYIVVNEGLKYKKYRCRIQSTHDYFLVAYESLKCQRYRSRIQNVFNDQRYRILKLGTRTWSDIPYNAKKLWTVFDNIAVIRNWSDKTLRVFDWERNTQLLTLAIPEQISDNYVVASVTEMRIVIVDTSSNQVVVFKFG